METRLRIALWCTPRTISTAVMRSFAQRKDTTCVDEPFYAWYLSQTGRRHPMQAEVLAAQPRDWQGVVTQLTGPCPTPVHFAKHMAHHMVGDVDLAFAERCFNVFLLRDPREMLASMVKDIPDLKPADTGYDRQAEIFHRFSATAEPPTVVVDSKDLLEHPEAMLRAVCESGGLEFDPAMLAWEPGRHPCYGVWAPAWYARVEESTGFRPYRPKEEPFPDELRPLLDFARPFYEELRAERLRVEPRQV